MMGSCAIVHRAATTSRCCLPDVACLSHRTVIRNPRGTALILVGVIVRANSHRPVTEICQGTGMGSDSSSEDSPERRFRTLFISDVHLGARGSQADRLLDFLRTHDADTIYLVGDIVDGWALKSSWYWPQSHNDFVQKMLRKARKGAKVIYVPGNHDEFLRNYYGTHFGGIDVVENT